jgi:predicted RNA-binding protein YlqC (UPF0109 family)
MAERNVKMEQQDAARILEDMLLSMVTALVDKEDEINISAHPAGSTVMFEVDVAKEDVGKLIGRSGKTAGALRHILGAASAKLRVRSILAIPDKKGE